ncbi:dihydrolipoyl dehydrogenase [candidate division WOR-3 bacterium 4484_100]|uniref:Dihydrolipoyl dehydrogenase n=1 Tax=candidate division WOR-3 bacterium 4484_100 TaxID=1936077 RepID=A0A1V4QFS4_UNCW3|nr:MAG: dihydrolipoyl dehydrogenase [candidate division WOR-3 bacterium 4484_100]
MKTYDVIIIGAGPAGYPSAIRLAQLKKKVLVIEKADIGGLCLNRGCIPTKALTYALGFKNQIEKAKKFGFQGDFRLDIETLKNWKDGVVKRLRTGVEYLFKKNGVDYIQGIAQLINTNQVHLTGSSEEDLYEAENIIIATGTEVKPLPSIDFDHKLIIDTDDALNLKKIPKSLLIIGAGASGLEMATIYSLLNCKVTVAEMMNQILPGMERELCEILHRILKKQGIEIYLNTYIESAKISEGRTEVDIKIGDTIQKRYFDSILVTVGRRPADTTFKGIGIKLDNNGFIEITEDMRTNIKNIYAIGDITGPPLLAHKATRQGIIATNIINGQKTSLKKTAIPSCVFTQPPFSAVGLTEEQARKMGYSIRIGRFPYRASGKALAMAEPEGMIKIVGNEEGKLLGLHILGAESPNLIGEACLAISKGLKVKDLAETIHPHPTLGEMIAEASDNFYHRAIHILNE